MRLCIPHCYSVLLLYRKYAHLWSGILQNYCEKGPWCWHCIIRNEWGPVSKQNLFVCTLKNQNNLENHEDFFSEYSWTLFVLFCFVLFFLIIIIIIHWAQGKSLIIFWPFDSLPWCWILPTISLHCHKENKYHGRVTKIQLVLLLNLIGWERGAITLWDLISLGLRWTLNLNWFQSILQKKNRYKDILIHMVLTLITAWRQRRTFSRTFNVIDLKNALVRKSYSLGNWV